jgi:phage-related protein
MSDANANILINAEINDRLSAALQRINSQLGNTVRSLNGLKATSQSAVGATNAVGTAISQLSKQSNGLGASLRNNARSQQALSVSFRNSRIQANALQSQLHRLQTAGLNTGPIEAYISQLRAMDRMQKQVGNSMRAMNFKQMSTQLNAFSQRMTNAGTRISMGLTLPLVAFFRIGFQSFKALDKQVIRTTKLMADSFDDTVKNANGVTDLGIAVSDLGKRLDAISSKWGVSRELVQGLAGDFAELGISDPKALGDLATLTVEFEKLGNIDVTQAQKTVQALFQTIARVRRSKGLDVTGSLALSQMTEEINGAIAFFNFAENKTTLSLNNMAEAFPEVTAAATSFGLSMQLTSAMLVPMIGAAFQTGASANSIKVSLQRMIATTKQNREMLESLSSTLGDKFVPALDVGSKGVMELVDNYQMLKETLGAKGTLDFMSRFFGVRQGPRMDVSIGQMAEFQQSLKDATSQEAKMAKGVEESVNAQLEIIGAKKIQIRNINDIEKLNLRAQAMDKKTLQYTDEALAIQVGQAAALSQNKAKEAIADEKAGRFKGKQIDSATKALTKQNKIGNEFNKITTETGKLIVGTLYGKTLTQKNKDDELERVRNSVEVQYGIARENAKSIARELTSVFGGILEQLNPIIEKIAQFFREMSPATKKLIGIILIAVAAIGPLMRTIGAVGQLGAMFSGARAAGIRGFRKNVVELNQSLMQTSDIALRIGGKFEKFGQDGKISTNRRDAKRLEKLAPIIAKQDAGEALNAKEKAKGTKYIAQLAGGRAVRNNTALLPKGMQDLRGLDQSTRDYVKSLDAVSQANKIVDDYIQKAAVARTSILSKTVAKVKTLVLRGSTNSPFYPTPTGAAIPPPAPFYPTPTGAPAPAAITAPIMTLRDILTQILTSIQAIQACVCNAKAAATGRPSPAASGAPTNAPPAGGTGGTTSAAATTGTPTPTGAAVTAVTGPIAAAAVAAKQTYAELIKTSPLFQKYGLSLRDVIITAKDLNRGLQGSISGKGLNVDFATVKTISQDAVFTKVLLEKYGIDINKIVDQYRQAVVNARKSLVAGARPTAPAPTVSPVPAAIEAATVAGNKVVAENIVQGAKATGGRPSGSTNKPKPMATPFAGDYGIGYAKSVANDLSVANKPAADFEAAGASIKKLLNLSGTEKTVTLTKDSLIKLFAILGQEVPEKLRQLDSLVGKAGKDVNVRLESLGKIAGAIKAGVASKALSPNARSGAAVTGSSKSPFYVQGFNESVNASVGASQGRAFTAIRPEDIAVAKESVAQVTEFEKDRQILKDKIKILADQSRDMRTNIGRLQRENAAAKETGNLSLSRALSIAIAKEAAQVRLLQTAISDLKQSMSFVNTELQSVKQSANVAFNNAQQQMASRGLVPFAGSKGKEMPFGSSTARVKAKRTGERYMGLAYGEKTSDGYLERTQVTRPSYSRNAPEEIARQAKRDALAPKRQAGINLARKAATQQPDYIAREKRRAAQAARDAAFAKMQEEAANARTQRIALQKTGVEPEKVQAVQASPVKARSMTQEDLLRINRKDIAEAQKLIPTLEQRVVGLQRRIAEINGQARVPGGKPAALRPLKADLKEAEGLIKSTKAQLVQLTTLPKPVVPKPAGGGGRVGGTSMLNDPLMGAMAGMQPRGPRMPQIGPRLASMDTGAITGGVSTVYGEIQTALKIPADIMQQVIKDLAVKHTQITGVGKAAVTQINGNTSGVIEELKRSIVDPANATVAEIKKAITDARAKFAKLETEALKAVRTGASIPATSAGRTTAPASSGREAFGYGLPRGTDEGKESGTQKGLAKQVADNIRATKKSTEDFLLYEKKTLEYIAKEFGIKGASKIKAGELVAKLQQTLVALGHSVEKAIVTEGIIPVTKATDAVLATSVTAAGASADETVALVNAGRNLGTAVEKTVRVAAETVTKAATAASSSMLALNVGKESRMALAQAKATAAAAGTTGVAPIAIPTPSPMLMLNAAKESRMALAQARARAAAVGTVGVSPISMPTVSGIIPTTIPSRPSRRDTPKTGLARTGELAKGVANPIFNPMVTIRGIAKTGSLIGSALDTVARKISPKRFNEQNVYKGRDYMGEARQQTFGRITARNLQTTSRQSRIAEKDARVIAKETRATDTPNRNVAQLTQSRIPSQFRQAINPSIDTLKAIAKTYGPPIKSAMNIAKQKSIEGLRIAGQITRELTLLPIRVPVVFTSALIEAHKLAMKGVRTGIAALESMTFFQTTVAGKSLLFAAKTIEKGLTRIATSATSAGQGLVIASQTAAKFVTTAFTNPKQALAMAATGLTNSKVLLFQAGAGLSSAAASIKVGAVKLGQATVAAGRAGVAMGVNASKRGMTSMGQSGAAFFYGGGPKGLTTGADGTVTKKAGLFGRSSVMDTSGKVTKGPGIMGRMSGGLGRGVMGGVRGLGTAAGSMSSMLLYQLGPAGLALAGPLNKVISLLTRTKMAFFGVTVPILLVVGAIFLLKRTFKAWGDQSTGVAANFKKAFAAIMAVVGMLKAAFFDFFASLFGGAKDSAGATSNIGKTMTKVAKTVRVFAEAFKAFFESSILPAIYKMLAGIALIIKGIVSFVGNLIKFVGAVVSFFRGGGEKATDAMSNAFSGMLSAIGKVLKGILKLFLPILVLLVKAVFKVIEFIVQLFEFLVIGVINLISGMVRGIINLAFTIVKAYVKVIDLIIDAFVFLQNKAIDIAAFMVKGVVKVIFGIIGGVLFVVQKIIEIFGLIPSGLGFIMEKAVGIISAALGGVSKLARAFGLGGFADGIDKFTKSAKDFTSDIANFGKDTALSLVNSVSSGIDGAEKKVINFIDSAATLAKGVVSKIGGVGNAILGLAQSVQNGLVSGVRGSAEAVNAFIGGFSDGIAGLSDDITEWLSGLADGDEITKGIGKQVSDAVKDVGTRDPSAAEAAGKSIADAIGKGMKSLKQNFYDKVVDNLTNSLSKLKDNITKALEKQKDQSLKFFDDQIAAIDALAAADAELTAEKQKQEDERLRIAERALQRDSYLKNRALAIYEGRIDDARSLGLEEAKNQQEFNKETEKNVKDASAAAKAKNVETAKKVIGNQKEAASIQFDRDLEDFQTFIENIGKYGTLTKDELTSQFDELKKKADSTSAGMQTAFQGYYNALPGLIATNTDPTVGFFTSSMDTLIAGAQKKFGLESGSTDPTSLLGVTNGMLGNMGTAYTTGFTDVVAPAYGAGQALLTGIATEFADPSTTNPKSAAGIYALAISNATAAVKAEFLKMKTDASSAFALVVGAINDELKNLAITQAIVDAKEALKEGGTSQKVIDAAPVPTVPAVPTPTPTPDTSTPSAPAPANNRFGPANIATDAFKKALGTDGLFKDGDKNNYIKKAKEALSYYGYSGFSTASDEFGPSTMKALKSFQKTYSVGGNDDGNLGVSAANALGLFSNAGVQKKYNGGMVKKMMSGGAVPGFSNQGVPAVLHGGEYVINAKAVQNLGLGLLAQLNGLKNGVPSINVPKPMMPNSSGMNVNVTSHSSSETTQNYNFYVDNFIGEDRWFESMMKEYNVKVIPNNQKAAGLESRVVRTYNGINRGM